MEVWRIYLHTGKSSVGILGLCRDDDDNNGDDGDCNGDDAGLVVIMTVKRFQSEVRTFPLGFVLRKCGFLAALFLKV